MMRWLRSAAFLTFGFTSILVLATFALLVFWAPRDFLWKIVVAYCRLTLWAGDFFCGMKFVVEGEENIPDEPCVIMIKHTTTLETYGHVPVFPRTAWVIKREIISRFGAAPAGRPCARSSSRAKRSSPKGPG